MKILGVIPSRYASTRFPGKPLADINGKSMVQRVYEQCKKSKVLTDVVVATDDKRIHKHVLGFGGKSVMTNTKHKSGTDRCKEALEKSGDYDIVINIQGDEPFIDPSQIDDLATCFYNEETQIATLIKKLDKIEELASPNKVKVILNKQNNAIYFSRMPLPYQFGIQIEEWLDKQTYYKHIGIYAYMAETLNAITKLPVSNLEKAESLEQLRWIEHGYTIATKTTNIETPNVDTPEDLKAILEYM